MLAASGIVSQLPNMVDSTGTIYRLFGDAIYPMGPQLFRMYRAPALNSPQSALNDVMAGARVSVEWGFNLVTNTFQGSKESISLDGNDFSILNQHSNIALRHY